MVTLETNLDFFSVYQIFKEPASAEVYGHIVTTMYVPYEEVQHRQLGVGGLLGVELLGYRQWLYI